MGAIRLTSVRLTIRAFAGRMQSAKRMHHGAARRQPIAWVLRCQMPRLARGRGNLLHLIGRRIDPACIIACHERCRIGLVLVSVDPDKDLLERDLGGGEGPDCDAGGVQPFWRHRAKDQSEWGLVGSGRSGVNL